MVSNNLIPPALVRPNVNGLQVLWLQESGIDCLWGKPLLPLVPNNQAGALEKPENTVPTSGKLTANAPGRQAQAHKQAIQGSGGLQRLEREQQASASHQPAVYQRPARHFTRQQGQAEPLQKTPPVVVLRPDVGNLDWADLRESVVACTGCGLAAHRGQAVFGEGAQPSDWMFVEESPGQQDDWHGQPFMGKAGALFDNMLKALGLQREMVFTTPLVKCRPVANIVPSKEEVASCQVFLQAQIEWVQPKCIVVFGRAANTLLLTNETIEALRGRDCFMTAKNGMQIPVVVTYHPNHLMVMQADKAKVWQDLQRARQIVHSA